MPQALPMLQVILPFLEKLMSFIENFMNNNASNSDSYNKGTKSLEDYLTETNANLSTLQDALDSHGVAGFDIRGKITTAQDARDVAKELQTILDKNPGMDKTTADSMRSEIAALEKAATELDKRGEHGSGGKNIVVQHAGPGQAWPEPSWIPTR